MTTAPTLFTLPPHLRENIASLITASIAPEELQVKMRDALAAAEVEEMEETLEAEPATRPEKDDNEENAEPTERLHPPPPQRKPPTIDGELLDELSSWAATPAAGAALKSSGLDPSDYSFIGLLAGAEVYLPPKQRALAAAADRSLAEQEKANPFLPTYLSPTPPSLGSEYRQLSRQLATVLNVLFSVFGVAGGVWYAAKSVGWTRERAMLLAILGGVVVGIADSVLLWIFKVRLAKDRKDTAKRRVRMNKGSAGLPGSARLICEEGEEDEDKEGKLLEGGEGEKEASSTGTEKRTLRLRRKPLAL